jgi:ankyrin repeat protein
MIGVNATLYANAARCGSGLLDAADQGDVAKVRECLAGAGADVNQRGRFGRSALFLGVRNGSLPVVQAVLEAGADIELKNDHGFR